MRKFLIVAPQVFQGKKLEVIVPQSSSALERFSGRSFISSNFSLNILPGSTSAKYWSQHTALVIKHINSVATETASALSYFKETLCDGSHNACYIYDTAEAHCTEDDGDCPHHTLSTVVGKKGSKL